MPGGFIVARPAQGPGTTEVNIKEFLEYQWILLPLHGSPLL